jgi:hypothetical protein
MVLKHALRNCRQPTELSGFWWLSLKSQFQGTRVAVGSGQSHYVFIMDLSVQNKTRQSRVGLWSGRVSPNTSTRCVIPCFSQTAVWFFCQQANISGHCLLYLPVLCTDAVRLLLQVRTDFSADSVKIRSVSHVHSVVTVDVPMCRMDA